MSISINIRGTIINFPSSGSPANWSLAVDQFALAVEDALNFAIGPYDIPPQTQDISANNPGTAVITNLLFSTSTVRSAVINISTYRTRGATTVVEAAEIQVAYDPSGPTNEKWYITKQQTGDASISYSISDTGQMSYTTTTIGSSGTHSGTISFVGKALTQV